MQYQKGSSAPEKLNSSHASDQIHFGLVAFSSPKSTTVNASLASSDTPTATPTTAAMTNEKMRELVRAKELAKASNQELLAQVKALKVLLEEVTAMTNKTRAEKEAIMTAMQQEGMKKQEEVDRAVSEFQYATRELGNATATQSALKASLVEAQTTIEAMKQEKLQAENAAKTAVEELNATIAELQEKHQQQGQMDLLTFSPAPATTTTEAMTTTTTTKPEADSTTITNLKAKIEEAIATVAALQAQLEESKAANDHLSNQNNDLSARLVGAEAQIAELGSQVAEVQAQMWGKSKEATAAQVQEVVMMCDEAISKLTTSQQQLEQLTLELKEANARVSELLSATTTLQSEIQAKDDAVEALTTARNEVAGRVEETSERHRKHS